MLSREQVYYCKEVLGISSILGDFRLKDSQSLEPKPMASAYKIGVVVCHKLSNSEKILAQKILEAAGEPKLCIVQISQNIPFDFSQLTMASQPQNWIWFLSDVELQKLQQQMPRAKWGEVLSENDVQILLTKSLIEMIETDAKIIQNTKKEVWNHIKTISKKWELK